jgi:hypothetical protein
MEELKVKDLSTVNHNIEKIPDFILLKESRKEVGQLKSEIDFLIIENEELKKKIKIYEGQKITREDMLGVKKEIMYVTLRDQLSKFEKKIHELRENNNNLICEIVKLRKNNGE